MSKDTVTATTKDVPLTNAEWAVAPVGAYYVDARRFLLNWLLCWHSRKYRRVVKASNGWDAYCSRCYRKVVSISEHRVFPPGSSAR